MPLRVHHYYPVGTHNSGDALVAHALRQTVRRYFGPAEFVDVPASSRYRGAERALGLCRDNIHWSNSEADLVLIGGSNMLEPSKPRAAHAVNLPLQIDCDALHGLRRPLLLAGMGTGSGFGSRIRRYSPKAQRALRVLFDKALASAVRDVTTVRKLADIGVATRCVGCPVTFLTDRPIRHEPCAGPLLVAFPPARILNKFLGPAFMRLAMKFVAWLRSLGVPLVVTLHESSDQDAARAWVPAGVALFHTEDLEVLIRRFEACRGVVGFRLHAALLGLGLGKPVAPVGVDWRGLGFIETFHLYDLAIRPFRFGQLSKLKRVVQRLLDGDAELVARQDQAKTHFRRLYETFFEEAAARFNRLALAG
ncbi:MAG: polysaccharide pyruvyl transferase family protein [Gemmataceae bacterium]|nr:polysaccharide pyruvyl transferase family protein [Gemmataceae bacterium]